MFIHITSLTLLLDARYEYVYGLYDDADNDHDDVVDIYIYLCRGTKR